jgi:hypothetical protein
LHLIVYAEPKGSIPFGSAWPLLVRLQVVLHESQSDVDIGRLKRVSYTERASCYSIQLLNGLCLEHGISAALSEERRRYLTSAITHFCEDDIEPSEKLAARLNYLLFDPI